MTDDRLNKLKEASEILTGWSFGLGSCHGDFHPVPDQMMKARDELDRTIRLIERHLGKSTAVETASYDAGVRWANQACKAELWWQNYCFHAVGSFPCPDLESLIVCLGAGVLDYVDDHTDMERFVDGVCDVANQHGWTDPRCHCSKHVDDRLHQEFMDEKLPEAKRLLASCRPDSGAGD